MNSTEVEGTWNERKGKLKQKFAILTDNDLMYDEGRKEEMFAKTPDYSWQIKRRIAKDIFITLIIF